MPKLRVGGDAGNRAHARLKGFSLTRVNYVTDFATRRRAGACFYSKRRRNPHSPSTRRVLEWPHVYICHTRHSGHRAARLPARAVGPRQRSFRLVLYDRDRQSRQRTCPIAVTPLDHHRRLWASGRGERARSCGRAAGSRARRDVPLRLWLSALDALGTDEGKLYDDHPPRRDLRHRSAGLLAGQPALQAELSTEPATWRSGTCRPSSARSS